MPDGSSRTPERVTPPRSEDEQFARDVDAFALRLLTRPTIRRALLSLVRDEVHRATRPFDRSNNRG